jgi:hypothetical protein
MATATMYRGALSAFANKELDWDTDAFSALLLDNTHTPDTDGDEFVADVVADEIAGGSYARVALSGKTYDATTSGVVKLLADDIAFAAMTATNVLYMVVYRNTGSDATAKLVCIIQFDSAINPTSETVTFNLSADGLINFTS